MRLCLAAIKMLLRLCSSKDYAFRWNLEDCFYDLAFANAEFA
jgi:hypothetical protein